MIEFLHQLGRVRANDITLHDDSGKLLYESPPSPYKAGPRRAGVVRRAGVPPDRASHHSAGRRARHRPCQSLAGSPGRLGRPDAAVVGGRARCSPPPSSPSTGSPAVRSARSPGSSTGCARSAGASTAPACRRCPGKEGASISRAFNGMAEAIEDSISARREAAEATEQLAHNRELTQLIQARIEQERGRHRARAARRDGPVGDRDQEPGAVDRAACDALGRRSGGRGRARHRADVGPSLPGGACDHSAAAAAGAGQFGLADALEDLLGDWRQQHPAMTFELRSTTCRRASARRLPPPPTGSSRKPSPTACAMPRRAAS